MTKTSNTHVNVCTGKRLKVRLHTGLNIAAPSTWCSNLLFEKGNQLRVWSYTCTIQTVDELEGCTAAWYKLNKDYFELRIMGSYFGRAQD